MHFHRCRRGDWDFMEFWHRPLCGCPGLTGAAAGNGNERDGGCAKSKEDTDHGINKGWEYACGEVPESPGRRWLRISPLSPVSATPNQPSLGGSHIALLRRGRRIRTAGNDEDRSCGYGSQNNNFDKFHNGIGCGLVESPHGRHARWRDTNDLVPLCKENSDRKIAGVQEARKQGVQGGQEPLVPPAVPGMSPPGNDCVEH
jgi:hypothetical protein